MGKRTPKIFGKYAAPIDSLAIDCFANFVEENNDSSDWEKGLGMPSEDLAILLHIRDERRPHVRVKIVLKDLNDRVYPLGLFPGSVVEVTNVRAVFEPLESYLTSSYASRVLVVGYQATNPNVFDNVHHPTSHLWDLLGQNAAASDVDHIVVGSFIRLLNACSTITGESTQITDQGSMITIYEFGDETASAQVLLDEASIRTLHPLAFQDLITQRPAKFS